MNCHQCRNMGVVPGNAHIRCEKFGSDKNIKGAIMLLMGHVNPDSLARVVKEEFNVVLSEHGIKHGWCYWPMLFDPIWVDECPHFEGVCPEHKPETKNKGGAK